MGPILYLIYTADLPITRGVTIGTFADDTAIMAVDANPVVASTRLQAGIDNISNWLKNWRIKVNETNSTHVTFTTRRETCLLCILMEAKSLKTRKSNIWAYTWTED